MPGKEEGSMSNLASLAINVVDLSHKRIKTTPLKKVDEVKIAKREKNYAVLPWRAITDERIHKTAAFIVLSVMCGYTNRHGETWVSQQTIADILKVSRQAIQKQQTILVKFGYLERIQRGGKHFSSKHRVVFDPTMTLEDVKAATPARLRDEETAPPPTSKEAARERVGNLKSILKGQVLTQPQKLPRDESNSNPRSCAENGSNSNQTAFLTQPGEGFSATSRGCTKEVEGSRRKGCLRIWKEVSTLTNCADPRAHAHACEEVDQWGIPDQLMRELIDHTISECRTRAIAPPTSATWLTQLGESAVWDLITRLPASKGNG